MILDIDDTLTSHGEPDPQKNCLVWLNNLKVHNIKMILVSNNFQKRVEPFAKKVNLPYIHFGMKPLPFGIIKALKILNSSKQKSVLIGDQIFTDVVAANLYGIRSILTYPLGHSSTFFMRFKRLLEYPIRKSLKMS